jgi:N utilization substance protein B
MSRTIGIRTLARQRALQLLYALEYAAPGETYEITERRYLRSDPMHRRGWGPFGRKLVQAVRAQSRDLDKAIAPFLHKWTIDRLPLVDLNCLRMALCELRYFDDVPMRVTINEYIELSRLFGTDESPVYINAILDKLAREFPHKDFKTKKEPDAAEVAVSAELDRILDAQPPLAPLAEQLGPEPVPGAPGLYDEADDDDDTPLPEEGSAR